MSALKDCMCVTVCVCVCVCALLARSKYFPEVWMVMSCQRREIKSSDEKFVTITAATRWISTWYLWAQGKAAGTPIPLLDVSVLFNSTHICWDIWACLPLFVTFYKVRVGCFANNLLFFCNNNTQCSSVFLLWMTSKHNHFIKTKGYLI